MDSAKLIKAREYYDLVSGGASKKDAALSVYNKKSDTAIKNIEQSPEYLTIIAAASQIEREQLRREVEAIKRKQIKTYSSLLDKGDALIEEANTVEEKVIAQRNQRENLSVGVVESAVDWFGEDRNKNDLGDVLEGVIL